jgi:Protocatechuate 3,4-dioxygenase beta subunit
MRFATLLLSAVLLVAPAPGQVITASVNGTVLDPAGAAVPNAKVRAVNDSTNVEVRTVSDSEGRYTFPSLQPGGPYSVSVEAAGFNTEERKGLTLEVSQAARIDFMLRIGAASDKLVVTAEAPLIDANSAALGHDIPSQTIVDLPLNERNPYSFVFLAPGVQGDVSFTYNNMNFSINGGRPGTTDILVDGIPSSPGLANPNQGIAVFPSVESVEEMKVQTNAYSAEFGRSGSGIINIIYKSGTNNFHGSLFEFLRNSNLDANSYYSNLNGSPLPGFRRNQFGASAGGPIDIPRLYRGRNKTFFFAAYEGLRRGSATSLTATFPPLRSAAGISRSC